MDPKLALKPCIVLQRIPSSMAIKEEADTKDIEKDFLTTHKSYRVSGEAFLNVPSHTKREKNHKPEKNFQCKLCTKSYARPEHLRRHMPSHTGEKPHKCDSCEKRFADRSKLVQHQRIHTNERPYKCTECDKAFRQYGTLQQHTRQHTSRRLPVGVGYERTPESKLYLCNVCDKSFMSKRWLKSHTRTFHTGEMPYQCKHCEKAFPSYQKYFYHMKSMHEEREHVCPDCGKRFAISWNLNSHRLLHLDKKQYVCSECHQRFLYAKDLKIHLLRHFGGLQTCDVCEKILCNPIELISHTRNHLFRKKFTCGECGMEFTQRSFVRKHFDKCHTGTRQRQHRKRKLNSPKPHKLKPK